MAKSPPANAGDMGSVPGLGRSHMLWSNKSPCALEPALCSERSHRKEQPARPSEEETPLNMARESSGGRQRTSTTTKH